MHVEDMLKMAIKIIAGLKKVQEKCRGFAYRSSHDNQKVIIQDVVARYQGQTQGLFIWASKLWFR